MSSGWLHHQLETNNIDLITRKMISTLGLPLIKTASLKLERLHRMRSDKVFKERLGRIVRFCSIASTMFDLSPHHHNSSTLQNK
jgi:hypothetical protein